MKFYKEEFIESLEAFNPLGWLEVCNEDSTDGLDWVAHIIVSLFWLLILWILLPITLTCLALKSIR